MLALRDGFPGVLVPEEASLVLHQSDAPLPDPCAWDAWAGVRPDAMAGAVLRLPLLPDPADAAAEKSAGLALACPASAFRLSAFQASVFPLLAFQAAQWARLDAAAALYTPDVGPSAARSCVELAAAEARSQWEQQDALPLAEPAAQPLKQKLEARQAC